MTDPRVQIDGFFGISPAQEEVNMAQYRINALGVLEEACEKETNK